MANVLKMASIQSILSLHAQGWSQRRIAAALSIDRGTVSRYVRRAAQSVQPEPGGISKPANAPIDPGRVPPDSKPATPAPNAANAPIAELGGTHPANSGNSNATIASMGPR